MKKTSDWTDQKERAAVNKVAQLSPHSKEKKTLLAIAIHANPDGTGAWQKIETIAAESGQSIRTVQYHIAELIRRRELVVEYQAKPWIRTNKYYIPICQKSLVSKTQVRIPFPEEKGATLAPEGCNPCTIRVQPLHPTPQYPTKTPNSLGAKIGEEGLIPVSTQESPSGEMLLKLRKKIRDQKEMALQLENENSRKPELSPEVEHLIQSVVQKLGESVESDERERVRQAYVRRAYEEAER